jgi:antitoxin (DNA-binding transcriptional repressor) of toxin-antitoxin stability system
MEEIAISKFKDTCFGVLEAVRKTNRPIRITRFGEAVADVIPPSIPHRAKSWIGSLSGTGRIRGDIVSCGLRNDAHREAKTPGRARRT